MSDEALLAQLLGHLALVVHLVGFWRHEKAADRLAARLLDALDLRLLLRCSVGARCALLGLAIPPVVVAVYLTWWIALPLASWRRRAPQRRRARDFPWAKARRR